MSGNEAMAASIGAAIGGALGSFVPVIGTAGGVAGGSASATFIYSVLGPRIERAINAIGPEMIDAALLEMGLDLKSEDGLNDETITAALNKAFLSGSDFQLVSVFDGEKMKQGLIDYGVRKISEELGLGGDGTIAQVVRALEGWVTEETIFQMAGQAGEIYDAVKERAEIKKKLAALEKPVSDWNAPTNMTIEGIRNREYQAKYRRNHKKHWEPKA